MNLGVWLRINWHCELSQLCPRWVSFRTSDQEGNRGSVQPPLTLQGWHEHVRKQEPVSAGCFSCSSLSEGYGNSWASEMLLSTKPCRRTSKGVIGTTEAQIHSQIHFSTKSSNHGSALSYQICPTVPTGTFMHDSFDSVVVVVRNSWDDGNASICLGLLQYFHE